MSKSAAIQQATLSAYNFFFNKPKIEYFKLSIDEIKQAEFEIKERFIKAIINYLKQLHTPTFFDLNKANKGNITDIELFYTDTIPFIKTIYEYKKPSQEFSHSVYKLDDFLKFICFKSVKEVRQITTKKGKSKKVDIYRIEIALLMNQPSNINETNEYFKSAKLYQNTSKINKFSFQFFIEKITPKPKPTSSAIRPPFYSSPMDVQSSTIRTSDKKIKLITDIEKIFRATNDVVSMEDKIKIIEEQIDIIKTKPLNLVKSSPKYTDTELEYIKTEVIKKINIRDTQLMPPPSKKHRHAGGTKKIIRKVFTDKKGKSYIKFNDFIIYLK